MGNSLMNLLVSLGLDASAFDKGIDEAKSKAGGLASGLAAVGGAAVVGGIAVAGAAIAGMGVYMKGAIEAASEAEQAQSQLASVLRSTAGAAGVTAQQVNDLATAFGNETMFEDDAIVGGENILLTFTNLGKNVFPLATQTMLDLSQAMGQDMKSSAVQLGKALNDPAEGLSALSRVGVTFTKEQEDTIKSLVKLGKTEEAQMIMLGELQREFGGSAQMAGETFAGKMTILKNKLGNVAEVLGGALIPIIGKVVDAVMPLIDAFSSLVQYFSYVITDGDTLNDFLADLPAGIRPIVKAIADFGVKVAAALPKIGAAIKTGFDWLINNKGVIVGILAAIGAAIAVFVYTTVIPALVAMVVAAAPVIAVMALIGAAAYLLYQAWTTNFGGIQEKVAAVWAFLQPVFASIAEWFKTYIPAAIQAVVDFWNNVLLPAFLAIAAWLSVNIPLAIQTLAGFWQNVLLPAIMAVWTWMSTVLFPFFVALADFLGAVFGVAVTALAGLWQNVLLPALTAVWGFIQGSVFPVFQTIGDYLSGTFGPVISEIAGFVGGALVAAFRGVSTAIQAATSWLKNLASAIANLQLPDWLTPGSPTPFELGLVGIGNVLKSLAKTQLPTFEAALDIRGPAGALAMDGGGNSTVNNTYNIFSKEQPGKIKNALTVSKLMGGAA
jgi:hypothetical protein